jgi:hypothetical protein
MHPTVNVDTRAYVSLLMLIDTRRITGNRENRQDIVWRHHLRPRRTIELIHKCQEYRSHVNIPPPSVPGFGPVQHGRTSHRKGYHTQIVMSAINRIQTTQKTKRGHTEDDSCFITRNNKRHLVFHYGCGV